MISVDAIVSAVLMVGVIAFWRWYGKRWTEPSELGKMIIGTAISALAPLTLAGAAAAAESSGHPVSLAWAIAFHVINDLGFANVLPIGLALYSRAAPKGLGGVMIAIYYIHLFIAGLLIGKLGGLMDTMSGTTFWLIHVGLMAVGLVILIAVRLMFGHLLAPEFRKAEA
jgi:POT family proton-dependent oligopeptide transporter